MPTPNKILLDLATQFKEYEERFEIIRFIDSAIVDDSLSFDLVSHKVTQDLKQILNIERAMVCMQTNIQFTHFFPRDVNNTCPKLSTDQLRKLCSGESVFLGRTPSQGDKNTLFVPCHSGLDLHFAIVLQDNMPVAEASRLCDKETVEFVKDIASQLGILLQTKVTNQMNEVKNKLIDAFFENELKPRRSWELIVEHAASFLPDYGVLAIDPTPLVQILTCSTTERYITLRATQGEYYPCRSKIERRAVGDIIPLKVDDTVCGLLVERDTNVLYVNPKKEFPDRYKAYMFGTDIPESELVIGIRNKDGELIALINLEHDAPKVLKQYHISLLQKAAAFLSPFIEALLAREARLYDKEIGLQYAMNKLLNKTKSLYTHKTGTLLAEGEALVTNLKKDMSHVKGKTPERIAKLVDTINELKERSNSFLEDMPEYINYGRVDVNTEIYAAVAEFDPDKRKKNENVDIEIEQPCDNLQVYASRMLREHIYNIIKNSLDAIRVRRQSDKAKEGKITISVSKFKLQDACKKETSPARVSIEIKDNGGGVLEKDFTHIMEFGFSTKQKFGGTGLGLSAAQEYAQFVHGGLELKNRLGEGLTVIFHLQEYTPDYHDRLIILNTWKGAKNVT